MFLVKIYICKFTDKNRKRKIELRNIILQFLN